MPESKPSHFHPLPAGEGRVRGIEATLHLTPSELPPRVRRYADNLTSQLITILKTNNVRTVEDLIEQIKNKRAQKEITHHQAITILEPVNNLLSKLNDIRKTGKLPESDEQALLESTLEHAEEIFGDSFLGPDQIESAFILQNGSKLIELDPDTRREAIHLLRDKLNEPDIQEFLKNTPPEILQRDFLLILRVPTFQDDTPLTLKGLNNRLQSDLTSRNQGKLLFNTDWYKDEQFFTTDSFPGGMHWQIVTKEVLPETLNKNNAEQSEILKQKANNLHLDPSKTRRRTPLEVIYDSVVHFRNTGTRLLKRTYDWTDVKTSSGHLVSVGYCDPDGTLLGRWPPDDRNGSLGAALSR